MASSERQPPTVKLDGERVRLIREGKSLTQLYVAEVVGVTVDTVSRWENNRTATVRRDNAEALAGALEVALAEIIREGEEELPDKPAATEPLTAPATPAPDIFKRFRRLFAPALLLIFCLGLFALWLAVGQPDKSVTAQRLLPSYAPPGSLVPVLIKVAAQDGEEPNLVVRERLPPGFTLVGAVPPPDQGPGGDGLVKWIVPLKNHAARIAYVVRTPSPARESSRHDFSGELVTAQGRGGALQITGPSRLDIEYVHWADEDADFRINDAEVLRALERLEALQGAAGLDPKDLRALWGAGTYIYDRERREFGIPVKILK